MNVPQFSENPGGIVANPPRSMRTSFWAPIEAKNSLFLASFPVRYRGGYKWADVEVSLAAFGPQIEDPVNPQ